MWIPYDRLNQKRSLLRKNSTPQEIILWGFIRNNALGYKFRRQHSVGPYVADFYCHKLQLVIEIDGSQHLQQRDYDLERERYFSHLGITTIRFWNNEINNNIEGVIMKIQEYISTAYLENDGR
jgi:very-short-patch-repair endonuclease